MPYTPPSHRSPASSAPASPDVSRRPSLGASPRPSLPRSASYLTKHRRTPSALGHGNGNTDQPTPPGTSTDLKGLATSSSVRQSPPPVTSDRGMPAGAVLSPPESASSGSDDEGPEIRGRQITNLKELKDAISQIPQRRETSPTKNDSGARDDLALVPKPTGNAVETIHHSFSTGSLTGLAGGSKTRGHTRSTTEPHVAISKSAETSLTGSEDESDGEIQRKPQMVRKKSGELVRPALRLPSRRRPSSMPGTPTYSKSVHFDSHEHVRHFLQVDRPLAVSAGSSPADTYDSDTEYPFPGEQRQGGARSPPYEWEIITSNFPADSPLRRAMPARLERVWLANDQKCLMGSIIVANLAFHKSVVCRFTLDYWKTTSEVAAEYSSDTQIKDIPAGHDRFSFTVKLSDLTNLESKTLYCCIRYNVNGQEYWDNNNGTNFQVDFRKKHLPQNGKKNFQGAAGKPVTGALPRSTRRASPSTAPRPKSMPVGFDDFGEQSKFNFDQPLHEYLGEIPSALRLKNNKSTSSLPSDNLSTRLSAPSGQAFANRYDFGASLTAAVQAAKDTMGKERDGLYMKSNKKSLAPGSQPVTLRVSASDPTGMGTDKAAPARSDGISPSAFTTASYEELVNKYCFFGSKQSSPQLKEGSLKGGRYYDGTDDGFLTRGTNSTNSSLDGSPQISHHAGPAEHHSLHPRDPNPYFQHASPGFTSLRTTELAERSGSPSNAQLGGAGVPATLRSSSPVTIAGGFGPYAGGTPNEFPFSQHLQQRFPFSADAPTPATASC